MRKHIVIITLSFLTLALTPANADTRRGFYATSLGIGSYDGTAPTVWNVDATLDADCQALFSQNCDELAAGQYEEVQAKYQAAIDAGYTSNTDYEAARALGYELNTIDSALWAMAKTPSTANTDGHVYSDAVWNADCDSAFSSTGGCDALTKSQYSQILSASGRADAIDANYDSYSDWLTASGLQYAQTPEDGTLWGEANSGVVSPLACDAEFAGKACNELTKSSFENARASSALLTAKKATVTAGTLGTQDLADLSISFSNSPLTSPLAAWQLDYLETLLPTALSATTADWQTIIDNYAIASAYAWYIGQIASSSATTGPYAASNAIYRLFHNANIDSGLTASSGLCSTGGGTVTGIVCAQLGITDAQTIANIRASGLASVPTLAAMRDFLVTARGFPSGINYQALVIALENGWTVANYLAATEAGGWSASAADSTAYTNCQANTEIASGGAGVCALSKSTWVAVNAIAAASDADSLTDDQLEAAIEAIPESSVSVFLDLAALTDYEADYLRDCVGSTVTTDQLISCVTSATAPELSTQRLSGIIAGDYTGSISLADLESAGLGAVDTTPGDENVLTYLRGNFCGPTGTDPCINALAPSHTDPSLVSGGSGSGTVTQQQLVDYLQDALVDYSEAVIDNIPEPAESSGTSCSTTTLSAPSVCARNPAFTCTTEADWTLSTDKRTISASLGTTSGAISTNVTVARNAWWTSNPVYSRAIPIRATLADGSTELLTYHDEGNNEGSFTQLLDNCFDAGGKMLAVNNIGRTANSMQPSNQYFAPYGSVDRDRAWWNAQTKGTQIGLGCNRVNSFNAPVCHNTPAICAGPAVSASFSQRDNINRLIAFSCSRLDEAHGLSFICSRPTCSP